MRIPGRPDPRDVPGALVMEARELLKRVQSGGRLRLVGLLFTFPIRFAVKVDGEWPLILEAGYPDDGRKPPILIVVESAPFATKRGPMKDVGYEAYPEDRVVVIPVPPELRAPELRAMAVADR